MSSFNHNFFKLLKVIRADRKAHAPEYVESDLKHCDDLEETAKKILAENQCFKISDLKINGNDVISLGVKNGRQIGFVLNSLLEAVICEEIENEREILLAKARVIIDGNA